MAAGDHTVTGTMTANKVVVADTVVVANLNADQVDGADKDIDGTLAGNSDASVPTEKAVKTYVDAHAALAVAGTHGSASAATASKLMHRDASGRSKVAAPAAADDIARKDNVDAVQTNLNTHGALAVEGTHGSTVAATANKIIHRDAAGRAKVVAPAASTDIALKSTVTADIATHAALAAAGVHGSTTAATPNKLVHRNASGRMLGGFPLLHIRDEQANNTQGGTFTAGAWRKRTLNTVKTNEISGASLASSQITLPAGTYEILARAPAFMTNAHKAKLRNITDSSDTIVGSNAHASATYSGHNDGWVRGRFTIAGAKVFELQHYAGTTREINGFGIVCNFSVIEVYAEVWIGQVS